jgi:hypothetical protein
MMVATIWVSGPIREILWVPNLFMLVLLVCAFLLFRLCQSVGKQSTSDAFQRLEWLAPVRGRWHGYLIKGVLVALITCDLAACAALWASSGLVFFDWFPEIGDRLLALRPPTGRL